MQPSSIFCRAREAHHQSLAHAATLDNVRLVANTAAAAWAKEGMAAVLRENRKLRSSDLAEGATAGEAMTAFMLDPSENPDRGHASRA